MFKHVFIAIRSLSDESILQIRKGMRAATIMVHKKGVNPIKMVDDLIKIFQLFPPSAQ